MLEVPKNNFKKPVRKGSDDRKEGKKLLICDKVGGERSKTVSELKREMPEVFCPITQGKAIAT